MQTGTPALTDIPADDPGKVLSLYDSSNDASCKNHNKIIGKHPLGALSHLAYTHRAPPTSFTSVSFMPFTTVPSFMSFQWVTFKDGLSDTYAPYP